MKILINKVKQYFKSKTINYGSLLIVFGLLYENFDAVKGVIPSQYTGIAFAIIGGIVIYLRTKTNQPLSEK